MRDFDLIQFKDVYDSISLNKEDKGYINSLLSKYHYISDNGRLNVSGRTVFLILEYLSSKMSNYAFQNISNEIMKYYNKAVSVAYGSINNTNKKGLYKFYHNVRRMGTLEGIFVSDENTLNKNFGKYAYFHDELGKHSEINLKISDENVTLISDDLHIISFFEKNNIQIGHNPLDYIHDEEE